MLHTPDHKLLIITILSHPKNLYVPIVDFIIKSQGIPCIYLVYYSTKMMFHNVLICLYLSVFMYTELSKKIKS